MVESGSDKDKAGVGDTSEDATETVEKYGRPESDQRNRVQEEEIDLYQSL